MNTLRPDELASQTRIEKAQQRDVNLKRGGKLALTAASTALAPALTARIAPFLSELIPTDLAIKGINKVSPKLGQFLDQGMKQGLNVKDGLNFIKENMMGQKSQQEPPKQDRNIIEQYSPELFQFVSQLIQGGDSPQEAGARARLSGKWKKEIDKISKDHKTSFDNIVQNIFGGGQMAQTQQRQAPQPQQPQQGQQSQGISQGQQQIMDAINRMKQLRGG